MQFRKPKSRMAWLAIAAAFAGAAPASADDWPQWLGPQRDGVWRETGIVAAFPAGGPKILWRKPVAGGYAGPAVADGRVYLFDFTGNAGAAPDPGRRDQVGGQERLLCFDAATGTELWTYAYDCKYGISYPAGPRCTPTIADGKAYILGAEGKLSSVDAATGKLLWSKDFPAEYKAETPIWGYCGHPLVDGKKLICLVGGEGSVAVAFDKDTGKELWRALSAKEPGYCPPTIVEAGGVRQLILWHSEAINGLDPETGKVYWTQPLKPQYGMSIAAPRLEGDLLYAGGIGFVGALFKLAKDQPAAELVWRGKRDNALYPVNSTPYIADGVMYGVDQPGALRAFTLADGKRLWETFEPVVGTTPKNGRVNSGTAFLVPNGDRTFLFNELGDLILGKLTPQGFEQISKAHILEPTGNAFGRPVVWSHPAFANKRMYARNDKEIVCVDLSAQP